MLIWQRTSWHFRTQRTMWLSSRGYLNLIGQYPSPEETDKFLRDETGENAGLD
jgi:hypothetical protein